MNKSQDEAKASGDGMTQSIRDAAQALHDIVMQQCGGYTCGPGFEAAEKARALRAALSAPQTTADERVAEHMRLVLEYGAHVQAGRLTYDESAAEPTYAEILAVQDSARSLLSASKEDAEYAAMYRWLVNQCNSGLLTVARVGAFELIPWSGDDLCRAIRAAMKEKKS